MGYCSRFLRFFLVLFLVVPILAWAAAAPAISSSEMARIVAGLQPDPAGFEPAASKTRSVTRSL